MATVYSLVCWGGRTGKVVTASNSSGLIFTLTDHGLRDETGIVFSGTTAPGNVTFGTTYYAKSLSTSTFSIYTEAALTNRVAWSSAGSGVIAKSKKMIDYFDQYAGRWGPAGSERCYDSFASWNTGRAGANATDVEACEVGESFSQIVSSELIITIPSSRNVITSSIDGFRTEGFHYGNFPESTLLGLTKAAGHIIYTSESPYSMVRLARYRDAIDGISFLSVGTPNSAVDLGVQCTAQKCIMRSTSTQGNAVTLRGALGKADTCLMVGWYRAWNIYSNNVGITIVNSIVSKNNSPMPTDSATRGFYYNNIVIGNTSADWASQPSGMEGATCNYGPAGAAWMSTGGVRYTIATTDFADYANNDFRPASASSPQVDTGTWYYDIMPLDLSDDERPNYNNGGSEGIDGGCYEFDNGYGQHPATATIALTNLVSGSRVLITRDDTSAVLYNDVPGGSLNLDTGYIGAFTIIVRKASASPYYREFTAGGTTVANQTTSIKALQQLDE